MAKGGILMYQMESQRKQALVWAARQDPHMFINSIRAAILQQADISLSSPTAICLLSGLPFEDRFAFVRTARDLGIISQNEAIRMSRDMWELQGELGRGRLEGFYPKVIAQLDAIRKPLLQEYAYAREEIFKQYPIFKPLFEYALQAERGEITEDEYKRIVTPITNTMEYRRPEPHELTPFILRGREPSDKILADMDL
jgi:hypothetical protein